MRTICSAENKYYNIVTSLSIVLSFQVELE